MSQSHPRHQLVVAFGNPVRFSLVAALSATDNSDFQLVRDQIQVSDSVLSKQASYLEELGLVKVKKGFAGKRPRTWLSLTPEGRARWAEHLAALRAIVDTAPTERATEASEVS